MILNSLQQGLKYTFKEDYHLLTALTHRSAGTPHNERLEFLGDALLGYIVAEILYQRFPNADEGELSRLRAHLVNAETLAEIAQVLELGEYLRLGEGEIKSGGRQRTSILADTLEAILGAIYLDGGISMCRGVVLRLLQERLDSLSPATLSKDPKTMLQEYLQAKQLPLPRYDTIEVNGTPPTQHFKVQCIVPGLPSPVYGTGTKRSRAEQMAAERALRALIRP